MSNWPSHRYAQVGIAVQFLALIRCLTEYFRLKYIHGPGLTISMVEPFIAGSLITAIFAALATGLYFARRFRLATAVAALTVGVLLAYKFLLIR